MLGRTTQPPESAAAAANLLHQHVNGVSILHAELQDAHAHDGHAAGKQGRRRRMSGNTAAGRIVSVHGCWVAALLAANLTSSGVEVSWMRCPSNKNLRSSSVWSGGRELGCCTLASSQRCSSQCCSRPCCCTR
jgi:hypothetical protein